MVEAAAGRGTRRGWGGTTRVGLRGGLEHGGRRCSEGFVEGGSVHFAGFSNIVLFDHRDARRLEGIGERGLAGRVDHTILLGGIFRATINQYQLVARRIVEIKLGFLFINEGRKLIWRNLFRTNSRHIFARGIQ